MKTKKVLKVTLLPARNDSTICCNLKIKQIHTHLTTYLYLYVCKSEVVATDVQYVARSLNFARVYAYKMLRERNKLRSKIGQAALQLALCNVECYFVCGRHRQSVACIDTCNCLFCAGFQRRKLWRCCIGCVAVIRFMALLVDRGSQTCFFRLRKTNHTTICNIYRRDQGMFV